MAVDRVTWQWLFGMPTPALCRGRLPSHWRPPLPGGGSRAATYPVADSHQARVNDGRTEERGTVIQRINRDLSHRFYDPVINRSITTRRHTLNISARWFSSLDINYALRNETRRPINNPLNLRDNRDGRTSHTKSQPTRTSACYHGDVCRRCHLWTASLTTTCGSCSSVGWPSAPMASGAFLGGLHVS